MRKKAVSRVILLLLATGGVVLPAVAAPMDWSLRDYTHTVWTHRDGISLARTISITQTTDGYLWLVSDGALLRFDGVRFVATAIPCERAANVEDGDNGSLWVLCTIPRVRLFNRASSGRMTEVSLAGPDFGSQTKITRDRRNRLWIYGRRLARLDPNGQLREFKEDFGPLVSSLVEDVAGTIWIATNDSIFRIREDHLEKTSFQVGRCLAAAPSGGVYVGGSPGTRIRLLDGDSDSLVAVRPPDVTFMTSSRCMAVDTDGGLWVGTNQHGVALIRQGRVELSLSRYEAGGATLMVLVDREGATWVLSSAGLHRFRRPHARLLTSATEGVPPLPAAVFVDSRGDTWIEGNGAFVRLSLARGLRRAFGFAARAFAEDDQGRVWIATRDNVGYMDRDVFRPVRDVAGAAVASVWSFAKDQAGQLWAAANGVGIYRITPGVPRLVFPEPLTESDLLISARHGFVVAIRGGGVKRFSGGREYLIRDQIPDETVRNRDVRALFEDGNAILMGDPYGLVRWRENRLTRWTNAHGLPGYGSVQEITRDRLGRLWLMTTGGILVLSPGELDASPDGAPRSLRFAQIGPLDRVVPHSTGPMNSPRVSADREGRLYFATDDSVAIVDPADMTPSTFAPPIVVESVVADNETLGPAASHRLVSPSLLRFEYTSLSLRSPENIRFRYRLEGHDDDWIEAGGTRQVTYGALRPGAYRFRVIGSGSEGVWNEEGAAFAFQVVPLFYNTWWFRFLIVAIVAAAIGGAHRLRVRRLTSQMQIRFEERLAERSRIARDLHDTLLQTVQGSKLVADHALERPNDATGLQRAMAQVSTWLGQATNEGRDAIRKLRISTLDDGDLAQVIGRATEECCRIGSTKGEFSVSGEPCEVHPAVRDDVYRIGYEAIRNACTHAGATRLTVRLDYALDLSLRVSDNGAGIDPLTLDRGKAGHFGLQTMRERAQRIGAKLTIESGRDGGTDVVLIVPGRSIFLVKPE